MMLPVALIVGLDPVQVDACRSALGARARVVAVVDAEDAMTLLSLHRPPLVVMRIDLDLHQRKMIAELTAKTKGRIASVGAEASPSSVEHLVEGFASVAFASANTETRAPSGVRSRVAPGEYHLSAPRTPAVSSKARR